MATLSKPRSESNTSKRAKIEQPAKAFSQPREVVADPSLSTHEKLHALNSLEQDARQLAVAAAEGMSGGEETNLRPVLQAKRSLEVPADDAAFTVVLRMFEAQLKETLGTDTHALIVRAIDAMKSARDALENRAHQPTPPPGAPKPGSTEELREELNKEMLDPGA